MRKLLLLIFFIPIISRAQTDDTAKIYAFLNQVLLTSFPNAVFKDSTYILDKADFTRYYRYGSIFRKQISIKTSKPRFSKSDSIYIAKCINHYEHFPFDQARLNGIKLFSDDTIRNVFKKDMNKGWHYVYAHMGDGYITMSVPIFFDKGKKAIFYYGDECGGLCGSGDIDIYENIGGKWVKKDNVLMWIR